MATPRRRAFTLIELLVVVSIIALLISLLLPSIGRAKEQARRAICSSNIHQIVVGYRVYGTQFSDFCAGVGVAFSASDTSTNECDGRSGCYMWYQQKVGIGNGLPDGISDFLGTGRTFQIDAVRAKGCFFCPSFLLNRPTWWPRGTVVNTSANPTGGINSGWAFENSPDNPTWEPTIDPSMALNSETRSSYAVRPTPPPDMQNPSGIYWNLLPTPKPPGGFFGKPPPGYRFDIDTSNNNGPKYPMPKFTNLGNINIVSDMVCGGDYLDNTHKDGVNTGRVDGSVYFLKRGKFDKYLSTQPMQYKIPNGGFSWTTGPLNGGSDMDNMRQIWEIMDKN